MALACGELLHRRGRGVDAITQTSTPTRIPTRSTRKQRLKKSSPRRTLAQNGHYARLEQPARPTCFYKPKRDRAVSPVSRCSEAHHARTSRAVQGSTALSVSRQTANSEQRQVSPKDWDGVSSHSITKVLQNGIWGHPAHRCIPVKPNVLITRQRGFQSLMWMHSAHHPVLHSHSYGLPEVTPNPLSFTFVSCMDASAAFNLVQGLAI